MNVRLLCEMFGWPVIIMDPDVFEQLPRGRQRIRRAVAALLIEATHTERFLAVVVDRLVISSVSIACVTHAETSQAHAPPAKSNTQVQPPWPHVMPSKGSSKKGTPARGSRGR